MKYNCLIADDNLIDKDIVALYVGKVNALNLVARCENGKEAAAILENQDIDIVFSDINMPDVSGISLLKSLKHPPVFVFITSYAEYAAESFNLDVIDFIVKPLTFERFFQAANKAVEYIELKKQLKNKDVKGRLILNKESYSDEYFFIKEMHAITKLRYVDVLYIESMGDFSKLYTVQNERHVTLVNLKNLEKQLPVSLFRRIHKQYIVNLDYILSIGTNDIQLLNKQSIPTSTLYRQALLDQVVNKKVITRFI